MKTLSRIAALSTIATAISISSVQAWSEPLACADLQQQIEQKLRAKGVERYALTVVEQSAADDGKKVVGTCAGGTKKILYSKKKESPESKVVTQKSGETPRKSGIKTSEFGGAAHQFVGTKKQIETDPWKRTEEVWGLTFSPEFEYEISIRPELVGGDSDAVTRVTTTEIRYQN